tara:strand:- start:1970 stop:2398 length:429 start_codon:yes stop_codon:yes gene_type:complete
MINYIIICCVILITIYLIYTINTSFENKTKSENENEKENSLKLNILSDCIIVLSREDCPYCTLLEEQLVNYTKKHTVIKLNNLGNFKFDDTFTSLDIAERENIIEEVKNIINTGVVYFPTIIVNNKMHTGLPSLEKIKEIFN